MKIHKQVFDFKPNERQKILVNGKLININVQYNTPIIYFEVGDKTEYEIMFVETSKEVDTTDLSYVNTFMMGGGLYVLHLYCGGNL